MVTEPSGCWRVSSRAARVRGSATPDAFSVWTNSGLSPGLRRRRMLALRAGSPPEAGRVCGVGERQLGAVEDLVAMQVRQRHLGRGHEEQVVRRGLVDVLLEFR